MTDPVWHQTVDQGTWRCWVEQNPHDGYVGSLHVARVNSDGTEYEVHQETVSIAYEARFGPDIDDILTWQETALAVIDAQEAGGP